MMISEWPESNDESKPPTCTFKFEDDDKRMAHICNDLQLDGEPFSSDELLYESTDVLDSDRYMAMLLTLAKLYAARWLAV